MQDTASICCLHFDGIGVWHSGIKASSGSSVGLKEAGNSVFPFRFQSARLSTTPSSCQGYVVDFHEWSDNRDGSWPASTEVPDINTIKM